LGKEYRFKTLLQHDGKIDEKGQLIEQVYYQKVARWVQVCRKLQQLVQMPTSDIHMAA